MPPGRLYVVGGGGLHANLGSCEIMDCPSGSQVCFAARHCLMASSASLKTIPSPLGGVMFPGTASWHRLNANAKTIAPHLGANWRLPAGNPQPHAFGDLPRLPPWRCAPPTAVEPHAGHQASTPRSCGSRPRARAQPLRHWRMDQRQLLHQCQPHPSKNPRVSVAPNVRCSIVAPLPKSHAQPAWGQTKRRHGAQHSLWLLSHGRLFFSGG